jgi:hypothetical protein
LRNQGFSEKMLGARKQVQITQIVPPLYSWLDRQVVNGGRVLWFIESAGLAPCFASASLQTSPRIWPVGNVFFVQESIGSIEPALFTGFFWGFHNGSVTCEPGSLMWQQGTRYGGHKSIFQGRDEDKKGEDLRNNNDGS